MNAIPLNRTSPSNLMAASLGVLNCARTEVADERLKWKIGADARDEIFKIAGKTGAIKRLQVIPPIDVIQFCGIEGELQGTGFPVNQLQLHGSARGHVGTVLICGESGE
jgi:hypothetical protein